MEGELVNEDTPTISGDISETSIYVLSWLGFRKIHFEAVTGSIMSLIICQQALKMIGELMIKAQLSISG
jgi:hypothetical protein